MKELWAPWRLEYILKEKDDACFLCAALEGQDDRRSFLLKRGRTCGMILNRYPYNNGHLMIFPYRHVPDVTDLTADEQLETMQLLSESVSLLRRQMRADGLNVGFNLGQVAGAGLKEHVHLHVVPRWNGDTNFMPVIGDVKVIPQAIAELWEQLHRAMNGGRPRVARMTRMKKEADLHSDRP